jgi:thiol-disulfide isomerase/thioredoxin
VPSRPLSVAPFASVRRLGGGWVALCLVGSSTLCACDGSKHATPEPATTTEPAAGPRRVVAGARFEEAPASDESVATVVVRERARVEASGGRLIVAVGASWCEPCRRFHDAVAAGRLDAALPGVVFLQFDHDRDAERLRADGYTSRLIPLYVLPDASGRAPADPDARMEGSIKGEGAVAEITPRLLRLLAANAAR